MTAKKLTLCVLMAAAIAGIVIFERVTRPGHRYVNTVVAAHNEYSQVLEEEGAKTAEQWDQIRIKDAHSRFSQEMHNAKKYYRSHEELTGYLKRNGAQLSEALDRLMNALKVIDPDSHEKINTAFEQYLVDKKK